MYEELVDELRIFGNGMKRPDHVAVLLLLAADVIEELSAKYQKALSDLVKQAEPSKEESNGV